MNDKSLIDAVLYRDAELVEQLIAQGAALEERDQDGATPLMIATASEQYLIAEQLVAAGADPFAMDSLYITAAGGLWMSNMTSDTPDGAARERLIQVFRDRGVPLPPPTPQDMPEALKDGRWPARAALSPQG
jgi:hypothetical protein